MSLLMLCLSISGQTRMGNNCFPSQKSKKVKQKSDTDMLLNGEDMKLKLALQEGLDHQCSDERLQLSTLPPPYGNCQKRVYDGKTSFQSQKDLDDQNFKTQSRSVKHFEQQCYDGRSHPNIKICGNFQQQVYERPSAIEFTSQSSLPKLKYTDEANLISEYDLRTAADNYPRSDIVMIVMMVKNLEHILQSKYHAEGKSLCMYL